MGKVYSQLIQVAPPDPTLPYLSHSRVNRYLFCPEQYRLYYIENLRTSIPSANLEFGKCIHESIAALINDNAPILSVFQELWKCRKNCDINFGGRDSWDTLRERGELLLQRFTQNEFPNLGFIQSCEEEFSIALSNLDVPFIGIIDLVTEMDDELKVVDFKTAGASYQEHEATLSDQLTAYQLAKPGARQSAFCVLIKTKEPRIEWYFAKKRSSEQVLQYLRKLELVGEAIQQQVFYKRPGKWCSMCDFLPICSGIMTIEDVDQRKQEKAA